MMRPLDRLLQPGTQRPVTAPGQNADTANDSPQPLKPGLLRSSEEMSAYAPGYGSAEMPPQNARTLLHKLRMRFPNLAIVPVPTGVNSLVLAANVAQDMTLQRGTVAMILHGTSPFYVSFDGNAKVPSGAAGDTSLLITPPWPYPFYIFGKNQISFLTPIAATVQAWCYVDTATNDGDGF